MSKLNVEHHIEVKLNLDEMNWTAAKNKVVYEEIKMYVNDNRVETYLYAFIILEADNKIMYDEIH